MNTTLAHYRTKPQIINGVTIRPTYVTAIQWTGKNVEDLLAIGVESFERRGHIQKQNPSLASSVDIEINHEWIYRVDPERVVSVMHRHKNPRELAVRVLVHDWIVRDKQGLFAMTPEGFAEVYELVKK